MVAGFVNDKISQHCPSPEGEGAPKGWVRGSGLSVAFDQPVIWVTIPAFERRIQNKPQVFQSLVNFSQRPILGFAFALIFNPVT